MSTYWEITLNDVEPLPGKMDELLSILKEYRFNIYYDIGTRFDASFYDWRSYDLADDLCADIAPLIASGSMHAKSDEDEDAGGKMVTIHFSTAWSYPSGIVEALAQRESGWSWEFYDEDYTGRYVITPDHLGPELIPGTELEEEEDAD